MIDDVKQAREEEKSKFHYSWLLILISFILWLDPPDYQSMDVPIVCLSAKYQNLWEDKENRIRKKDNNIEFFMHAKSLRNVIKQAHRVRVVT